MSPIPREPALDSTLAFLREGYAFIPNRCARMRTDIFETRLMLRRAVCVSGAEAAAQFYVPGRMTRRGAIPPTALLSLQDRGSVNTLDGPAHHHRKAMFVSLMTRDAVGRLGDVFEVEWRRALEGWEREERVVLFHAARAVLTRAACAWAAVPLASDEEARRRTDDFGAMIEGAGAVGPRNWRGLLRRARTERWARGVVRRVRDGALHVPESSPARVIAMHRDADGRMLDVRHAAVELLNILRPTAAVDRYVAFCALALHEHAEARASLDPADDASLARFANEVRRLYPFFPAVGGRVLEPFEWHGHRFARRDWVMLDLHGTNHDPRLWEEPHAFRPERFVGREPTPFDLIPQGGGDHLLNHRCAGEWATIELMKRALRLLTTAMRYEVPPQDLTIDLGRMPAIPRSRLVISSVRRV